MNQRKKIKIKLVFLFDPGLFAGKKILLVATGSNLVRFAFMKMFSQYNLRSVGRRLNIYFIN